DGRRDFHVTGVQTCALPIYVGGVEPDDDDALDGGGGGDAFAAVGAGPGRVGAGRTVSGLRFEGLFLETGAQLAASMDKQRHVPEIGRASCRQQTVGREAGAA